MEDRQQAIEKDRAEPTRTATAGAAEAGRADPVGPMLAQLQAAEVAAPIMERKLPSGDEPAGEAVKAEPEPSQPEMGSPAPQRPSGAVESLAAQLGLDIAALRIDTSAFAESLASRLQATAVAFGDTVHFGAGALEPGTGSGDNLIRHELAHVAQFQRGALPTGPLVSEPTEAAETQAAQVGRGQLDTLKSRIPGGASRPRFMRQVDPAAADPALAGVSVAKNGIAYKEEGVNLRQVEKPEKVLRRLPFNATLFVERERADGYYVVTTSDGEQGLCAKTHIKTNLPEPGARIHWIKGGETALGISHKYYGGEAVWNADHRFFVNGLVHVNRGGIYKPPGATDWDQTEVDANYMIWVPSHAFLMSLKGVVSSGSITGEAWEKTKSAAEAVADFVVGAGAFVAGLLHGAVESVVDLVVGIYQLAEGAVKGVVAIIKSAIAGELAKDAKALWGQIVNFPYAELVQGWIDDFKSKWDAESVAKRWHFRGWVIGYAIVDVLLLFAGGAALAKWAGKGGKLAKALSKVPGVTRAGKALKNSAAGKKLKKILEGGKAGKALKVPQGFTEEVFARFSAAVRKGAGHFGDDIAVHGSRASGTAKATSDIDVAIKVTKEQFDRILKDRFGKPNPGSAKERTMLHAIKTGKIQAGEAGLRSLRKQLAKEFGMPVDISVIKRGGAFDKGPYIPLK